jgi:hypothetical protein
MSETQFEELKQIFSEKGYDLNTPEEYERVKFLLKRFPTSPKIWKTENEGIQNNQ